ncbi:tetratricopeptide repeat protein [uncultured Enterovirga sp.]|uniref:tetratricopeptide repeat protein n=1 Tax=uncultured Enterovirga sp. TaxID=2026352 RepID=UPI0035CB2983
MRLPAILLALALSLPASADDRSACGDTTGPAAIAACDRAIASERFSGIDLAKLHTNRGVERKRAGDLDGALADYTDAIRLNPTDPFAFNNRANTRRDKGDLTGAIADYAEALRVHPGYTGGYVNRGLLHERSSAWALARADYTEAIMRPPKYANGRGGQEMARQRLAAIAGR